MLGPKRRPLSFTLLQQAFPQYVMLWPTLTCQRHGSKPAQRGVIAQQGHPTKNACKFTKQDQQLGQLPHLLGLAGADCQLPQVLCQRCLLLRAALADAQPFGLQAGTRAFQFLLLSAQPYERDMQLGCGSQKISTNAEKLLQSQLVTCSRAKRSLGALFLARCQAHIACPWNEWHLVAMHRLTSYSETHLAPSLF